MNIKRHLLYSAFAALTASPMAWGEIDFDLDINIAIGKRIQVSEVDHREAKGPPPWAPAHGRRAKEAYYYYPKYEVYRNARTGAWIYYRNGDWSVGMSLPSGIRIGAESGYVSLEMDSSEPHRFHSSVTQRYPSGLASTSLSFSSGHSSSHPSKGSQREWKSHPGKGNGKGKKR